jgi:hypothetical protein
MTMMMKVLMGGAGFAALAAATPATAQYSYRYGSNVTQLAAQRCAAAVQNRLSYRGNNNIIGALLGGYSRNTYGRVLNITQVNPNRNTVRVRGLASSGRMAYNPYGVGAYGMLGSNYAADLSFKCDVDYGGYVRDVDINRR